jgi:hypothetical protein
MVDDLARAAIASSLPFERARLARAFQSLSDRGRRALVDGLALCRAKRLAGESCAPRGSVAVVFRGGIGRPLGDETYLGRLEERLGRALKPKKRGPKPKQHVN